MFGLQTKRFQWYPQTSHGCIIPETSTQIPKVSLCHLFREHLLLFPLLIFRPSRDFYLRERERQSIWNIPLWKERNRRTKESKFFLFKEIFAISVNHHFLFITKWFFFEINSLLQSKLKSNLKITNSFIKFSFETLWFVVKQGENNFTHYLFSHSKLISGKKLLQCCFTRCLQRLITGIPPM